MVDWWISLSCGWPTLECCSNVREGWISNCEVSTLGGERLILNGGGYCTLGCQRLILRCWDSALGWERLIQRCLDCKLGWERLILNGGGLMLNCGGSMLTCPSAVVGGFLNKDFKGSPGIGSIGSPESTAPSFAENLLSANMCLFLCLFRS